MLSLSSLLNYASIKMLTISLGIAMSEFLAVLMVATEAAAAAATLNGVGR